MTSMIDVVFLLLVFFVWTSSFDRPEQELFGAIAMPSRSDTVTPLNRYPGPSSQQDSETRPPQEELVVRIFGSNALPRYQLGAVPVATIEELSMKLEAIPKLQRGLILIIDPDDAIATSYCVAVFDAAANAGLPRVYFAVDAE